MECKNWIQFSQLFLINESLFRYFGGFTKITEFVTTPFVLPPLQKVFDGDHRCATIIR